MTNEKITSLPYYLRALERRDRSKTNSYPIDFDTSSMVLGPGYVGAPEAVTPSIVGRIWQAAKLQLFAGVSGMTACPASMSDAAISLITKKFPIEPYTNALPEGHSECVGHTLRVALDGLLRNKVQPGSKFSLMGTKDVYDASTSVAFTSGQWFTEQRQGGSDLSASTCTVAIPVSSSCDVFRLYGYKWFTSAVDSEVSVTLAREITLDSWIEAIERLAMKKVKHSNPSTHIIPYVNSHSGKVTMLDSSTIAWLATKLDNMPSFVKRGAIELTTCNGHCYTDLQNVEHVPFGIKEAGECWNEENKEIAVTIPLTCYLVLVRKQDNTLNHLRVEQLKEKVGTRQLPTAELSLDGTVAIRIGKVQQGVATGAEMLNITRMYNALSCASYMKVALLQIGIYSTKRFTFSKFLIDHETHRRSLAHLSVLTCIASWGSLELAALLELRELNPSHKPNLKLASKLTTLLAYPPTSTMGLYRLWTPLVKLGTAEDCVFTCLQTIELFGAVGYMEPSGIGLLLRDSIALAVWEGPAAVCVMDVMRVVGSKDLNAANCMRACVEKRLHNILKFTQNYSDKVQLNFNVLVTAYVSATSILSLLDQIEQDSNRLKREGKEIAMALYRAYATLGIMYMTACGMYLTDTNDTHNAIVGSLSGWIQNYSQKFVQEDNFQQDLTVTSMKLTGTTLIVTEVGQLDVYKVELANYANQLQHEHNSHINITIIEEHAWRSQIKSAL